MALAMASRLIILAVALGVALHGLAAAAVAAIAGLTCNGITFISYTDLPSFNTQGSHDSVIVQIGAGPIDGGSTLIVSDIYFDLACRHKGCSGNVNQNCSVNANCPSGQLCLNLLPGTCVPDGSSPGVNSVAGFVGVVSNTCTSGPPNFNPITFTSNSAGGGAASPSEVVLTASEPMHIPAATTNFCQVKFTIEKLSLQSFDDTPTIIEERAGFMNGQCDNGLAASTTASGSVAFSNTPTTTPTVTSTPPSTPTASYTTTLTPTPTPTMTPSTSPTPTQSPTPTNTATPTSSATPTETLTPTVTPGPSPCGNGVLDPGEECDDGNTVNHDGCDNNCKKSVCYPTLDNMIPGYCHSLRNDCQMELCTGAPAQQNAAGLPAGTQVCHDDDPTCDFGPSGDGACTFHIAFCFNVTDTRVPCIQSHVVDKVVFVVPNARKPGTAVDAANLDSMIQALRGIGGKVQGVCRNPAELGKSCEFPSDCNYAPGTNDGVCRRKFVSFTPPLDVADTCSGYADIKVPLRQSRLGAGANLKQLRIRAYAPTGVAVVSPGYDGDVLTLVCLPK